MTYVNNFSIVKLMFTGLKIESFTKEMYFLIYIPFLIFFKIYIYEYEIVKQRRPLVSNKNVKIKMTEKLKKSTAMKLIEY